MNRRKMLRQSINSFVLILLMVVFFTGCGTNDKEAILGIWKVNSSKVEGREIGDGKGWFEFKSDGTVDTRPRPGKYDSGTYVLNQDKGTIELKGDGGGLSYAYELGDGKLTMSATMPNDMKLLLECEKVDDYPITKENDIVDDGPVFRPG